MDVEIIGKDANKVQVNTAIGCFIGNWCSLIPADKRGMLWSWIVTK